MANGGNDITLTVGYQIDELSAQAVAARSAALGQTQVGDFAQVAVTTQSISNLTSETNKASEATDGLTQRTGQFAYQSSRSYRLAADAVNIVSSAILTAGVAIDGSIALLANNYIKTTGDMNATTEGWTAAQKELSDAGMKAGQVLATEELPYLKQIADLANWAAGELQKYPELGEIAGAIGTLLTVTGTIGKAVATGIRLYADYTYITAVSAHTGATTSIIPHLDAHTAALLAYSNSPASGGMILANPIAGQGMPAIGGSTLLGTAAVVATGIASFASLTEVLKLGNEAGQSLENTLVQLDPALKNSANEFDDVRKHVISLAESLPVIGGWFQQIYGKVQVSSSEDLDSVITKSARDATETYLTETSDAVQKEAEEEVKIKTDEAQKEVDLANKLAQSIQTAEQDYANDVSKIVRDSTEADANALAAYQQQRSQTVQSANNEIIDAEQSLRDKLYDLEVSHNDKMWDLGVKRDALGIEKENQSYAQEQYQDIRDTNQQVAKDRRDEAQKLADDAETFNREQQQRHIQEADQLADAKQQEDKAIAQAQQNYDDQLAQAQQAEQNQLDQLRESLAEQEKTYYQSYVKQLETLGTFTGKEADLWNNYYAWLDSRTKGFINGIESGAMSSGVPVHDYSGMAYTGTYAMAQNGQPQYVLSGDATAMAQRALGNITEQKLLSAINGGSNSNVYSINQNFYGDYSDSQMRLIKKQTLEMLSTVLQ